LLIGSLQIEGEQALKDLFAGEVVGPTVGVQDGVLKIVVGKVEPGRAVILQVGEGVRVVFCH
jgi:hypothetical protein